MRIYLNMIFMWIVFFFTVFTITINESDEVEIEQMNIQLLGKHVLQMIESNMTLEDNIFQKSKLILLKNVNFRILHDYFHNNFTNKCLWRNQTATLKNTLKLLKSKYHKINKCFDSCKCSSKIIKMNLKSLSMFIEQKIYHQFQNASLNDNNCFEIQSLSQEIYWIHNLVLLTLIKGHLILMSGVTGNDQQQKRIKLLRQYNRQARFLKSKTTNILRHSLPREIRQRDPKIHVEGVTYDRLKYFIQGYITGEQFLNKYASCGPKCSDYSRAKHYIQDGMFTINSNLVCHGTIHDCVGSSYVKICEQPHSRSDDRRYAELIPRSKEKRNNCLNKSNHKNRKMIKAFTVVEAGILPWDTSKHGSCELCACYCDYRNNNRSIRSFSLKAVNSNINQNYVITGIRFRIVNRVICLQIQQGKLMNTIIDPKTVSWQPVDLPKFEYNNDIVRLDYDQRSLNLDDIEVSPGSVVTGVKFQMIDGRLTLMVSGVEIHNNGFINSSPVWYSAKSNVRTRKELNIYNLNVPTSSSAYNEILTEPNEYYVKFTTTSWKTDEAQTVVPFIDLQDVITDPPSPVGGVGIYHKRQKDDGGFIAPKLLSIDYSSIL